VIFGLALALACAVATSVAFLLKQRGAVLAPPVSVRHPLKSGVDLFRSWWLALGWMVAIGAWGLHVGALALAPLSIVQAVLSGGLGFVAVLAERFFGFQLGRRQWAGVIVTAAGLAIIGLTSGSDEGETRRYALAALVAIECGVFVVATAVAATSTHRRVPLAAQGLLLGAAAGALFGVSDIADQVPDRRCRRRGAAQALERGSSGRLGDRLLCLGPRIADRPGGRGSSSSPPLRPT
jgi:drug/metabolite transporter (DMT)-like permease